MYISTLAVELLPKPSEPPANQTEFLASTIQPIVAFMVLCSVTIHGLSIPFFSLGRRVRSVGSRTWSRHASSADWALHTKHITRGEDVVINRDPVSAMEKGEGAVMDSESKSMTSALEDGEPDVIEENRLSPTATLAELPEENKKEDPPDGTELTLEWREGPHKIIEKRGGPGQEVSRLLSLLSFLELTFVYRSKLKLFAMRLMTSKKTSLLSSKRKMTLPCRRLVHTFITFATVRNRFKRS